MSIASTRVVDKPRPAPQTSERSVPEPPPPAAPERADVAASPAPAEDASPDEYKRTPPCADSSTSCMDSSARACPPRETAATRPDACAFLDVDDRASTFFFVASGRPSVSSTELVSCAPRPLTCVMTTTSGMEHRSRSARMSPMENGSSHCASSTSRIQPGKEGCAGAACVARPRSRRSSMSAIVLHRRAAPCVDTKMDSSVFLRRCRTARKRLLWSRRCTPLRWRVNATAPLRRPMITARAIFASAEESCCSES